MSLAKKPTTLAVYYGNKKRWDWPTLDRIQKKLGLVCEGFDGLQADFEYATQDEAFEALLIVRGLGITAETGGVGRGPSREALRRARAVMKRSYEQLQNS